MDNRVPFLDLRITDDGERQDLLRAVEHVFRHGRIVLGPEVSELEAAVAARCGRKYGVGVSSGTDALFFALKALDLGPSDEVITTSLSWIATANAIAMTGATPVFADIRDDLNIDPASVLRLIGPRTKAILPVHYTGKVCDMTALMEISSEHRLHLVEDASQSFDAEFHGTKAGSFGVTACFSMNPMKVFAACGEAGMVVTDREDLRDRLIRLRYNGTINREECVEPSFNGRIDTLQAAILLERLPGVAAIIERRRKIARWYDELLSGAVEVPREEPGCRDVYYTYTIRTPRRDALKAHLEAKGIETKIQHPILMPRQPAYRDGVRGEFPKALQLVEEILCIPAHEKLSDADVHRVADCIRSFCRPLTLPSPPRGGGEGRVRGEAAA
jgi:dTDP-4-amino-4,6-dideoxygalactose transaminase